MPVSAPDGSAVLERGRPAARAAQAGAAPPAAKSARPAASRAASPPAQPEPAPGTRSILEEEPPARRSIVEVLGVWGFAILVHVVVLLGLSFIVIPNDVREQIFSILGEPSEEPDDAPIFDTTELSTELTEMDEVSEVSEVTSEEVMEEVAEVELAINEMDPSLAVELDPVGVALDIDPGSITQGRTGKARSALLQKYGGNAASEQAVASALKWIADQQRPDGSWNFDDVGGGGGRGP